jgi:hypothetical protein
VPFGQQNKEWYCRIQYWKTRNDCGNIHTVFGKHNNKQKVLGRTNSLLSFDTTSTAQKSKPQQIFVAGGTSLPSHYLATIRGYTDRPTDFPLTWHEAHRKWRVQQLFYYSVCIRCGGNVFTEPLPSNLQTYGKHLWWTPFKWAQISCDICTKFHETVTQDDYYKCVICDFACRIGLIEIPVSYSEGPELISRTGDRFPDYSFPYFPKSPKANSGTGFHIRLPALSFPHFVIPYPPFNNI